MRKLDDQLLLSATDLVDFLACEHLAALELARVGERIADPPPRPADMSDLVARKGEEYERRHLDELRQRHGPALVEIERGSGASGLNAAADATRAAMEAGAPVIFQASFVAEGWTGHVDFLERVERPSKLGPWSYEPADTKLARSLKPYFVIQLCLYADLVAAVQGIEPRHLHVILGSGERRTLRLSDFHSYFRRMRDLYAERLGTGLSDTYPDPVSHCELCRWAEVCEERRVEDDHLSLVAGLGGAQATRLAMAGITTVTELAEAERRPSGMGGETFERLHVQAELQVAERETGKLQLRRLVPELPGSGPLRGFARMPRASEGDVFFDIEGDPFYENDGLEYLWGASFLEEGEPQFSAFWGTDRRGEKEAFGAFVDFVFDRRQRYPDMHVYHYAPYERTALARMMGLHATREEEVDRLLREHILVDLYPVVTQSLRISRPSYSLKEVELFYLDGREAEVKQAGDSVLMFERWLEDGSGKLLEEIEAYNKEDCDSTRELREWLVEQRRQAEEQYGIEIPWRSPGGPPAVEDEAEALNETAQLQAKLLAGVSDDPLERTPREGQHWLLAQLLDYHRREAKPAYWKYIARIEAEDLIESDAEAIGGLEPLGDPEPIGGRSRSHRQRLSFPPQDHRVKAGDFDDPASCSVDPQTGEVDYWSADAVEILAVDDEHGTLDIRIGPSRLGAPLPRALIPGTPIPTEVQRAALRELAADVLSRGLDAAGNLSAARDILGRRPPRTSAVEPGGDLQTTNASLDSIADIARGLEGSYLFIQGPPGSGKTYTGAKLIIDLIAAGKKVGVTANSHKAICRLLEEVELHATPGSLKGLKKSSDADDDFVSKLESPLVKNSRRTSDFPPGDDVQLIAGTSWLWCREEMRESVDYLVIDEAGQVSLADALAMSTAATNIILLGDPLQLAQVVQGAHPPGSDASVLEHLLADAGTIPPDRGIFLDKTRRMHPDVCEFVSHAIYEGRLESLPECANQRIGGEGFLSGTGVRSLPVEHRGNSRESIEEAKRIAEAIQGLAGARFIRSNGTTTALEQAEIMVVTPYNAQVRCLRQELDAQGVTGVRVGTVDKFQGQEAAVVFFSMATSSGEEIPRTVDFLYSRNRLNVAVSRARCLAVLVASPDLLTVDCRTVEQMRLVNALCMLDELGRIAA